MFVNPGAKQSKRLELHNALHGAVASSHGDAVAATVLPACTVLHQLRNAVHEPPTTDIVARDLTRYIVNLNYLLDVAHFDPSLSPPLLWVSAFDAENDTTISDLRFDRQASLYNLAACHSHLASKVYRNRRTHQDPYKVALLHFRKAAGLFAAAALHPVSGPHPTLTLDLHPQTCTSLKLSMLANAQQMFYNGSAIKGEASDNFLALIALGVRDLYADAAEAAEDPDLASSIIPSCIARPAAVLSAYFNAVGLNHLALHASSMPEQLTRLADAQSAVTAAQHLVESLDASPQQALSSLKRNLTQQLHALSQSLSTRVETTNEENRNYVYASPATNLPTIPGRRSVKPVDYPECIMSESVHEHMKLFSDLPAPPTPEMTGVATRYADMASAHASERVGVMNASASSLTLAISAVEVSLPTQDAASSTPSVDLRNSDDERKAIEIIRQAQNRGAFPALKEMQQKVLNLASETRDQIDGVERLLREEEAQDRELRERIRDVTRPISQHISQPYFLKLGKLRSNLDRACNADLIVSDQVEKHSNGMALLLNVRLPEQIPPSGSAVSGEQRQIQLERIVYSARPMLHEARGLLSRKDVLVSEYERKKASDDAYRATASLGFGEEGVNVERLSIAVRTTYSDLDGDADSLCRDMEECREKLSEMRKSLEETKGSDGGMDEHLMAMNEVYRHQAAAEKLKELFGHLEQGMEFYSKEQSNIGMLLQDSERFIAARGAEYRDIVRRGAPRGGDGGGGSLYPGSGGYIPTPSQRSSGESNGSGGGYNTWRRN